MPAQTNLTVKKNDGTTDVTYSMVAPAGGDKSPAIWRNESIGTAASHRPTLQVSSRNNGTGTARRVEGRYVYPSTVTGSDGKVAVADRLIIEISAVVPSGMPTADVNEAVSQGLNLYASAQMKDSCKTGYAPT